MARRDRDDFSIAPLPRERRSAKIQRYILALTIAVVIAASLVVLASVLGLAIAPLLERNKPDQAKNADLALVAPALSSFNPDATDQSHSSAQTR